MSDYTETEEIEVAPEEELNYVVIQSLSGIYDIVMSNAMDFYSDWQVISVHPTFESAFFNENGVAKFRICKD